jgi:hypothetical protein
MSTPYRSSTVPQATPAPDAWRRARAIASNYGRGEGWFVFWKGRRIGELTDPLWADMFWVSYRFDFLVDDRNTCEELLTDKPWQQCELTFRTRETDLPADGFASRGPRDGRVVVRGVYVCGPSSIAERVLVTYLRFRLRVTGRAPTKP